MMKNRSDMMSIGELARAKGVSVKSLRYYDRIGVLKPAYRDPETGYRYYVPEQMMMLDIIRLCITFDLPLRSLRDSYFSSSSADLRRIILDGRREASEKIREASRILSLTDDILGQIERLDSPRREKELYSCTFPERALLTLPWDQEKDGRKAYIRKISQLHLSARGAGLTALSQQGLLNEYGESGCSSSIFLAVRPPEGAAPSGCIRLPRGLYTCMRLEESEIPDIRSILAGSGIYAPAALCLNTDIYDYCLTNHIQRLEVQIPSGEKRIQEDENAQKHT